MCCATVTNHPFPPPETHTPSVPNSLPTPLPYAQGSLRGSKGRGGRTRRTCMDSKQEGKRLCRTTPRPLSEAFFTARMWVRLWVCARDRFRGHLAQHRGGACTSSAYSPQLNEGLVHRVAGQPNVFFRSPRTSQSIFCDEVIWKGVGERGGGGVSQELFSS